MQTLIVGAVSLAEVSLHLLLLGLALLTRWLVRLLFAGLATLLRISLSTLLRLTLGLLPALARLALAARVRLPLLLRLAVRRLRRAVARELLHLLLQLFGVAAQHLLLPALLEGLLLGFLLLLGQFLLPLREILQLLQSLVDCLSGAARLDEACCWPVSY